MLSLRAACTAVCTLHALSGLFLAAMGLGLLRSQGQPDERVVAMTKVRRHRLFWHALLWHVRGRTPDPAPAERRLVVTAVGYIRDSQLHARSRACRLAPPARRLPSPVPAMHNAIVAIPLWHSLCSSRAKLSRRGACAAARWQVLADMGASIGGVSFAVRVSVPGPFFVVLRDRVMGWLGVAWPCIHGGAAATRLL